MKIFARICVLLICAASLPAQTSQAPSPVETVGALLLRVQEESAAPLVRHCADTAPGLVTFNAFIAGLARANLLILSERGLGAKLSRSEVASVAAEVSRDLAPVTSAALGLSNAD